MLFNMWFYIYYYYFETSATDGKQKRIINVNVIQVVSALLLSTTRYVTTNVCTVFKWQQIDIVRKWARCTFKDFSLGFVFANYKNLVKSNTLINKHIIRISFFILFFFSRNCMFYLKQSLHVQWPRKYNIRSFRSDKQEHFFLTFKGILLSISKIYLVYKTLDLVDK